MKARLLAPLMIALAARAGAGAVKEVVVVFKTHFDIGYTAMARDVVAHYRTGMIDKAPDPGPRRQVHRPPCPPSRP